MILETTVYENNGKKTHLHENLDLLCNALNSEAGRVAGSDPFLRAVLLRAQAAINELSKEKEPMEPVRDETTGRLWLCGRCGSFVGFEDNDPTDPNEFHSFCYNCGRKVKWGHKIYDSASNFMV